MPLVELLGNEGTVPPAQIVREDPKAKVGGILGSIVTLKLVGVAQRPGVGVKV